MLAHLRKLSDDMSLTLEAVNSGSIFITIRSSRSGFGRLDDLYRRGQLGDLFGLKVEFLGPAEDLSSSVRPQPQLILEELEVGRKSDRDELYSRHKGLGPNPIPALRNMLMNTETDVQKRQVIILMLGEFGSAAADAVPDLANLLQEAEHRDLRLTAALTLGFPLAEVATSAIPALTRGLNDKDEKVRIDVAWALGNIGRSAPTTVVPPLVSALNNDKDGEVRKKVARSLGNIGRSAPTTVVPPLVSALNNDKDGEVRMEVVREL
jgi:hypothetical protein